MMMMLDDDNDADDADHAQNNANRPPRSASFPTKPGGASQAAGMEAAAGRGTEEEDDMAAAQLTAHGLFPHKASSPEDMCNKQARPALVKMQTACAKWERPCKESE